MDGRLEYKYLVPNRHLEALRTELAPYMENDPFTESDGLSEYTVRSIYYDTPHFGCYLEKIDGLEMRQKYRIRGYNQPTDKSVVFLEIKMKRGSLIGKHRAPLLHTHLNGFMDDPDVDRDIVGQGSVARARDSARRFLFYYYRYNLRPTVLVVYDREAYFGRFDPTLRLTFDKRVRGAMHPTLADLYRDQDLTLAIPGHFVFEVKFFRGALPAWVTRIIRDYELLRMSVSKYTICLDASQARRRTFRLRRNLAPDAMSA